MHDTNFPDATSPNLNFEHIVTKLNDVSVDTD